MLIGKKKMPSYILEIYSSSITACAGPVCEVPQTWREELIRTIVWHGELTTNICTNYLYNIEFFKSLLFDGELMEKLLRGAPPAGSMVLVTKSIGETTETKTSTAHYVVYFFNIEDILNCDDKYYADNGKLKLKTLLHDSNADVKPVKQILIRPDFSAIEQKHEQYLMNLSRRDTIDGMELMNSWDWEWDEEEDDMPRLITDQEKDTQAQRSFRFYLDYLYWQLDILSKNEQARYMVFVETLDSKQTSI